MSGKYLWDNDDEYCKVIRPIVFLFKANPETIRL